jgi:molecular chaperone GrpE
MISRQVRATEGRRLSHLPTSPLFLRGKVYPEREPEAEREEDDNMINQEPEEGNPGTEPEIGVEEDVEALRQTLAEEKEKAGNYLANWQRVQADFANYKRRSEQEKGELGNFAKSMLAVGFLAALDDLERALASIPSELADDGWVGGIKLIGNKFQASLESQGISSIEGLGQPFDPNLHEAMRQDKGEEGIIIEELQKGYKLNDRVIRPSMVVVGNGEVASDKKQTGELDSDIDGQVVLS